MKDALLAYRLVDAKSVSLTDFDPTAKPVSRGSKARDKERLEERVADIGEMQNALFAEGRRALLVIFQGMDTSGKDGAIYSVFQRVHPLGMRPVAFKAPSPEELEHDFLWRIHPHAPQRGEIGVWNRSHYEDVVVAKVAGTVDEATCQARYEHINDFERLLRENGTRIIKIFLHVSRSEQKKRLESRLADPRKHWKFSLADLEARRRWPEHRRAYEAAFRHTSCVQAPWWIVPADSKSHRDLMVAEIVWRALVKMAPVYPPLAPRFVDAHIK
jgi:PPK2 family polyphosphate:nucleotide phosphotransferase